jgi:hypothetical protein
MAVVKTTLRVPDELLAELKHLAIDERTSINDLMLESIQDLLKRKNLLAHGAKKMKSTSRK